MDGKKLDRDLPVKLVTHETATNFFSTAYNLPWIKVPVCFLENNILHINRLNQLKDQFLNYKSHKGKKIKNNI